MLELSVVWISVLGLSTAEITIGVDHLLLGCLVVALILLLGRFLGKLRSPSAEMLIRFDFQHPNPCFVSDDDGLINLRNPAADEYNPNDSQAQSVHDLLSHIIADPRTAIFRILERLEGDAWSTIQFSTRSNKVGLAARRIGRGKIYWRISETKVKPINHGSALSGCTLSIGRHGAILSVSDQLTGLLGQRPKNIRDFMEWPVPKSSGTCRLRTAAGMKNFFCLFCEVAIGRSELSFFELPSDKQLGDDLFDALPIPMLQLGDNGNILGTNAPGLKFIKDDALVGKRFHDVFKGVGRPLVGWVAEVLNGEEDGATQFAELLCDGKEKFVQVTLCRVIHGSRPFLVMRQN